MQYQSKCLYMVLPLVIVLHTLIRMLFLHHFVIHVIVRKECGIRVHRYGYVKKKKKELSTLRPNRQNRTS